MIDYDEAARRECHDITVTFVATGRRLINPELAANWHPHGVVQLTKHFGAGRRSIARRVSRRPGNKNISIGQLRNVGLRLLTRNRGIHDLAVKPGFRNQWHGVGPLFTT